MVKSILNLCLPSIFKLELKVHTIEFPASEALPPKKRVIWISVELMHSKTHTCRWISCLPALGSLANASWMAEPCSTRPDCISNIKCAVDCESVRMHVRGQAATQKRCTRKTRHRSTSGNNKKQQNGNIGRLEVLQAARALLYALRKKQHLYC